MIAAPILAVLATGVIFTRMRADANDPLRPLKPYILQQQTFFVAGRAPNREATLQVWAWLSKDALDKFNGYGSWLTVDQGWNIFIKDPDGFQATKGAGIVPSDSIAVSRDKKDMLLIYSRQLSPIESVFCRLYYKHLGYNDPPPTKP